MNSNHKIAVICNYELQPGRVGGMDYFFWMFDQKCKENKVAVDWFFPNKTEHGNYSHLSIFASNTQTVESFFLEYCQKNQSNYSHIVTHFVELCTPFFYKINRFSKAKIIAVDHNPRPLKGYSLKKKVEKKIKGILYSKYIHLFVGVSKATQKALLEDFGFHLKNKTIVVFNGINVERFIQKKDFSSHSNFIIASHLRKEKGIQDVIEAVKNLKEYSFTIDVYGKGNYELTLKQMVHEYSLGEIIRFKGSVADLYERYAQYDYLIHPSHGETFCYSVVESLLSNLPVITTRNQGNVLGLVEENKNGFLFDETNVTELELVLRNILNKEKAIQDIDGKSISKDFSLEKMVDNHFALIQENKL
ncbi:glycosyltransferase family 4 protein [Flavobacterium ovatum]|uniref:glycosyltransferase family 4 protein n=1 Tax=Flavobacterium ovatum TaxID=1928857 RepID=UPI00344DCE3D